MTASRLVRVTAGLHPVRIGYFEATGMQTLEFEIDLITMDDMIEQEFTYFHNQE